MRLRLIISRILNILRDPPDQYVLMRAKIEMYRIKGAIIGNNVRLWGNIDAINPHLVTIGDNVCLADQVYIITHCPVNPGPVVIGDNTWIGFRSIVLPNVTIGKNSLIGAGSLVTSDIPPGMIACGNPAKVIRERDKEEIDRTIYLIKNDLPVGKIDK